MTGQPHALGNPKCIWLVLIILILTPATVGALKPPPPSVPPPSPGVRPSGDNHAFVLLEPMTYMIGTTGVGITVPAGFVTDYASIPRRLWSLYSPHDQYSRAAIVHDYLYWSQKCTRAQADNIFSIAMKESDVSADTRRNVYQGVHLFGKAAWEDNKKQRKANMPRIVPVDLHDFPPNWSWERYRVDLIQRGVRDPPFIDDAKYCIIGNTDNVPTLPVPSLDTKPPNLAIRALKGMSRTLSLKELEIRRFTDSLKTPRDSKPSNR